MAKSNNRLKLVESGSGGWEEMTEDLSDGKIFYGFCRFEIKNIYRYVYLAWCGEGVQGLQKGQFNNHSHDMQRFFNVCLVVYSPCRTSRTLQGGA